MQQKKIAIIAGVIFLVLLAIGGFYFLSPKSSQNVMEEPQEEVMQEEVVVPTLSQEELGLTFVARSDKKAVKFTIAKISGIKAVEYEVSYLAKGDIPRGAIGNIEVKTTDKKIETNYIDLGTCSSGRCKYDEGVESVKLLLKIVKDDGNTYSAQTSLDL